MLEAVRKFARKVLLLHAVLLVLVIGIAALGSRAVYQRARDHAIEETKERQELLAKQTASGIEAYYAAIISQLEQMQRKDDSATGEKADDKPAEASSRPAEDRPPPRPPEGPGGPSPEAGRIPALLQEPLGPPRFPATRPFARLRDRVTRPGGPDNRILLEKSLHVDPTLTSIMWKLLQGRVACLFVLDPKNRQVAPNQAFPREELPLMRQIALDNSDFLKDLQEPTISSFLQLEGGRSGHLIAVPATTGMAMGDRTLVAFVPVTYVKAEFFDPLNNSMRPETTVYASLIDKAGNAIISLNPVMAGKNILTEISDPDMKANVDRYVMQGEAGSWTVEKQVKVGDVTLPPRILAAEPVSMLGRRWTVLISSPISATDAVIRPIFDSAILWAGFFALSVTGLLASTSFFMIRGRMKYERARHEMLAREIDQARQIQLAWLPDANNVPAGMQISAANLPASHISGDFYNWFELPDPRAATPDANALEGDHDRPSRIAVVIGDVTGHGMAAAFLMATTQLLVRTTLLRYQDPGRCLELVNKQLCTQTFRGQFVTMVIMILDPESSSIEVATAGHPAPLVAQNGKFAPLAMDPQLVLGVDPNEHYRTEGFLMEPGGSVLLYTDGVVEAEDAEGRQYGLERLMAAMESRSNADSQQRIHAILEDVKRFCQNRELHDDVTLVAIRTVAANAELAQGAK